MPQIDMLETLKAAREGGADPADISLFISSVTGHDLEADYNTTQSRMGEKFNPDEFFKQKAIELSAKAGQQYQKQQFLDEEVSRGVLKNMAIGYGKAGADVIDATKQNYANLFGTEEDKTNINKQINSQESLYKDLTDQTIAPTIGNVAGNIVNTVPLAAIPGGQGTTARVGIGGALGAAQSALTAPVSTDVSTFSQGKQEQASIGAVFGAGFPAITSIIQRRPIKGVVQYVANRGLKTDKAKIGQEFNAIVDNHLSVGEVADSDFLRGFENLTRQYATTRDEVLERDAKLAQTIKTKVLDPFVESISKADPSDYSTGLKLQEVTRKALDGLVSTRQITANNDYGLVRKIAGDKPVIQFNNVVNELKSIISENADVVSGSDAKKVANQAQRMLKDLTETITTPASKMVDKSGKPLTEAVTQDGNIKTTVNTALKSRLFWSKASAGKADIFEDITSKDIQRSVGARLVKAANKDFEETGQLVGGELKDALAIANSNYAKYSDSITALEHSILGKTIGKDFADQVFTGGFNEIAGETAIKAFRTAPTSTIKAAVKVIERQPGGQEMLSNIRANWIVDAITKGEDVTPLQKAAGIDINFNSLIKKLPTVEQMTALGATQAELNALKKNIGLMTRTLSRFGINSSGTQTQSEVMGLISSFLTGGLHAAVNTGGKILALDTIAKALMSPVTTDKLKLLSKPGMPLRAAERILADLLSDYALEK